MTSEASSSGHPNIVTGLFKDSESVERAYQVVAERGYGTKDINVIMSDDTRRRCFSDDRMIDTELVSKAQEGASLAAPWGNHRHHRAGRSSRG
jgi:hypothetical protein